MPDRWMRAARYFAEELGVDVNVRDAEGFTALHHAAARGDNQTINDLVGRGADVMAVNGPGKPPRATNGLERLMAPATRTAAALRRARAARAGAKNIHVSGNRSPPGAAPYRQPR